MLQKFGLHLAGKVLETCFMFVLDRLPFRRSFFLWDHLRARVTSLHNKMFEFNFRDADVM
jgi:hypothetical protein